MKVLVPLVLALVTGSWAQQLPSTNVLYRVVMIEVGDSRGSAFTIERAGKQYLITTRHMVAGLPLKGATIRVFQNNQWRSLEGDVILPADRGLDVAAFTLKQDLTAQFEVELGGSVGVGQQGYFLGFPHGWHSDTQAGETIAFVKQAILSAVATTP